MNAIQWSMSCMKSPIITVVCHPIIGIIAWNNPKEDVIAIVYLVSGFLCAIPAAMLTVRQSIANAIPMKINSIIENIILFMKVGYGCIAFLVFIPQFTSNIKLYVPPHDVPDDVLPYPGI